MAEIDLGKRIAAAALAAGAIVPFGWCTQPGRLALATAAAWQR